MTKLTQIQASYQPKPTHDGAGLDDMSFDRQADALSAVAKNITARSSQPTPITTFPITAEAQLRQSGRTMLLADICALLLSFILGGVVAWAINTYVLDDGFQELLNKTSAKQFMLFMALGGAALLWLDQQGHYRQRLPFWETVGHAIAVAITGMLVGGFIQFAAKNDFSRLWLGLSWMMFAGLLFAGRALARRWLKARGQWTVPVLLLGNAHTADAITAALRSDSSLGYNIVSRIDSRRLTDVTQQRDWQRLLAEHHARYVMVAMEGAELQTQQDALKALARTRIPFSIVPPWSGLPVAGVTPHSFFTHDAVLMYNTNRLSLPLPRLMKRSFDILVSGMALLLLSPLFAFIALMVKRDGGEIILNQFNQRVGLHGRHFTQYKFRSMVRDNDVILKKYLEANPAEAEQWAKFQKLSNDPRITPFGRFIRKTSLDELPQLFNVFKGDMSLVGPRPILLSQKEFYGDDLSYYTAVRPGITGPWQVSGRNTLSFDERVQLEAWYARNWSLWMDIVILLKTPGAVVSISKTS